MKAWVRSRPLPRAVTLVVLSICVTSCHRYDETQRKILATNSMWTVTAVGDLNSPGQGFGRNLVKFEVERLGKPYASGPLYDAGPHDRPFQDMYARAEWVSGSTLRLWYPPAEEERTLDILVRNDSTQMVNWLQVTLGELFLVLELAPGESVKFKAIYWGPATLRILGQAAKDRTIDNSTTFREYTKEVTIAIKGSSVEVTLTE